MTGPKLNEAPVRVSGRRRVRVQEETASFRSRARYIRVSAYKVREVLDLIRGLDAERARETLRLSERDAATVVGKAGRNRWKGVRPQTRGVAMNPVDHPLGGGEGKSSGGRHPVSPWGKPEGRTRDKTKPSQKLIVRRRRTGRGRR